MPVGDGQIVTIAAAREHLRVGDEATDAQIAPVLAAAEAAIADELGRPLISIEEGDGGWADAAVIPPNVEHAIKVALTSLWDDRNGGLPQRAILSLIGRWVRVSVG